MNGENPLTLLRRPLFFFQSLGQAIGGVLISFGYSFVPASVATSILRPASVFFSLIAGNRYFHEKQLAQKLIDKEDHALFLSRLREYLYPEEVDRAALAKQRLYVRTPLPSNAFDLINYCLMPNHFHFLMRQKTELSPSVLLNRLCNSYLKVFNKKTAVSERYSKTSLKQFLSCRMSNSCGYPHISIVIRLKPLSLKDLQSIRIAVIPIMREYITERSVRKTSSWSNAATVKGMLSSY